MSTLLAVTLLSLLLRPQPPVNARPQWLVTEQAEKGSKGKRIVVKSYQLVGTSNLVPRFKEQVTVPPEIGGGWGYLNTSQNGTHWVRFLVDPEQRNSTISVWSVNPLRLVTKRSQGWITDARWLYQGNSLAIVSEENERPTATLISGEDGRVLYRFDGCLGVLDHPKRRGAIRIRTDLKVKEFEAKQRTIFSSFDDPIRAGRIWAEETSNFRQWRKVDPLAATRGWILSGSNNRSDLVFPLSARSIGQTVYGFKDHWLLRSAEMLPPIPGEGRGKSIDRLLLAKNKSLTYTRREVESDEELYCVSPSGAMLISGSTAMDYTIPMRRGYHRDPEPFLGVRVDLSGTKRFRIKNPVLLGSTIVLWSP